MAERPEPAAPSPALSFHDEERQGPRIHVLIPTHTTRHLASCLASLAWQRDPPNSVVVTCDTDDPSIGRVIDEWWPRIAAAIRRVHARVPEFVHVSRPHQGEARLNQVRNNGLRALDSQVTLLDPDVIVTLDGDTLLDPMAILAHRMDAAMGAQVIVPFRINLDEAATSAVSPEAVLQASGSIFVAGPVPPMLPEFVQRGISPDALSKLKERDARYRRQLVLRRSLPMLTKPHKPKLLGGHHAVTVRCLRAVNGYDEEYTGYGFDDDDLARRLYQLRPLPRIAITVSRTRAYHLWHPTRAPSRPTDAPGYARFARTDLPMAAAHGWKDPIAQPQPVVRVVSAGK